MSDVSMTYTANTSKDMMEENNPMYTTSAPKRNSTVNFFILSILFLVCSMSLFASGPWQTFTNTSHVFDIITQGDKLLFSSWGGVIEITAPDANTSISLWEQTNSWNTGNGLPNNDIRHLQSMSNTSALWFGSEIDGISIVSPKGIQVLNESIGLPSNRVRKILEAGDRILVATASGIAEYYYLPGVSFPLMLHRYNRQNTGGVLLSDELTGMALSSNRYLWLCSSAGLNYVHLDSLDIDSAWKVLNTPNVLGIAPTLEINDNYIAVGTGSSIYRHSVNPYQPGWTTFVAGVQLKDETISTFALDGNDDLWVAYGTWDEDKMLYRDQDSLKALISRIEPNGTVQHFVFGENGLGNRCVSRILCKDGNVYLGTWGDGVYRLEDGGWNSFKANGIGFPKITQIAVDKNHTVWFSSGNYAAGSTRKSALGVSRWKDGIWETFNVANSPLHSDNILAVNVDSRNRKWFGAWDVSTAQSPPTWRHGLTIWDDQDNTWTYMSNKGTRLWNDETGAWSGFLPGFPSLMCAVIPYIGTDLYGNVFVGESGKGFTIFNPEDDSLGTLQIPSLNRQVVNYMCHNGRQYFFGSRIDRGLAIWNHDSVPFTGDTDHWVVPPCSELLLSSDIYGVVTVNSPYEGIQHWIAASTGLFMWDETYWYKYDTAIKRYRYNALTNEWDRNLLYYVDEERLYGAERTFPTCIFKDPFERIWIGTVGNGISMYDPVKERFTNYYPANSPLLSAHITALGYEPNQGLLLIGTPDGLNTFEIGKTVKNPSKLVTLKAYPNPFYPSPGNNVQIVNEPSGEMPVGTNGCRIYDSSGALVMKLKENDFFRFEWDGRNKAGNYCASGVYFFVISTKDKEVGRGKIMLIRKD